ncbi:hypothetical protein AQUCO_02200199v1 [Aquilegia coerulea]|uniref:Uracil-DNA glycosylase n=1 Tax=Aquilegia coerulea TaxID=218851 RepID=A0A2G5DDI3_AQUCA|nr:hypothetical protein AQUCO_02200199v1 [Aquilegia coerulea]
MASSKTLVDFFQPAKRMKLSETLIPKSNVSSLCKSSSNNEPNTDAAAITNSSSSNLTTEQRTRMEFNKSLANAKRNLKLCSDRISKAKEEGKGFVKLEELLVEETWLEALPAELQKPYTKNLSLFVEREMSGNVPIYPPAHLIFNALNTTPFDRVKTVIIGQDPYHGPGQAMGLSFSVPEGIKVPSSLVNIFKELKQDLGCSVPSHGNLERWALQGVLLLNTVLTVKSRQANSHAKKGWEPFTDVVIQSISLALIDESKHHILRAAHPSGLSTHRGFFGCRHFSQANQLLERMGTLPIDWKL